MLAGGVNKSVEWNGKLKRKMCECIRAHGSARRVEIHPSAALARFRRMHACMCEIMAGGCSARIAKGIQQAHSGPRNHARPHVIVRGKVAGEAERA